MPLPCSRCGQTDTGQTGDYPCLKCGVPLRHNTAPSTTPEPHDEPARQQFSFDVALFAAAVRRKRGTRSLREAQEEIAQIGAISVSTLSRIEHDHDPDLYTLEVVCEWLQASPSVFFNAHQNQAAGTVGTETGTLEAYGFNTVDRVAALLQAEKRLTGADVSTILHLLALAYNAAKTE